MNFEAGPVRPNNISYFRMPEKIRRNKKKERSLEKTGYRGRKVFSDSKEGLTSYELVRNQKEQFILAQIASLFVHVFPVSRIPGEQIPDSRTIFEKYLFRTRKGELSTKKERFFSNSLMLEPSYKGEADTYIDKLMLGVILGDWDHSDNGGDDYKNRVDNRFYDFGINSILSDIDPYETPTYSVYFFSLGDLTKFFANFKERFPEVPIDHIIARFKMFLDDIYQDDFPEFITAVIKKSGYIEDGDSENISKLTDRIIERLRTRAEDVVTVLSGIRDGLERVAIRNSIIILHKGQ